MLPGSTVTVSLPVVGLYESVWLRAVWLQQCLVVLVTSDLPFLFSHSPHPQ